jgi:hypothetical protein
MINLKSYTTKATITAVLLSIIWIAYGCATISDTRNRGENNLRERVEAYYASREEGNFFKAFDYEHMSLDGKVERRAYASSNTGAILNVKIEGIRIEGDVAFIKIHSVIPPPQIAGFEGFNSMKYDFEEKWVFKNNNWYHIKKGMMGKEY